VTEWGDVNAFTEEDAPRDLESSSLGDALADVFGALVANATKTTKAPAAARMRYGTAYLSSPHWREFRQLALDFHGRRCFRCGYKGLFLNVHHLTYERLGNEHISDVVVLCRDCHRREHGITGVSAEGDE
jgi:hypothetical protein